MVATTLSAFAEAATDCRVFIWNVRNMCETSGWFWICVGMVIAILTVLSGGPFVNPIPDDCSWQKETDENAAWRRPMKNELKHHEKVFRCGLCVEPCREWCGLRARGLQESSGRQRGPSCLCESSAEYRETTV